MDKVTLINTQFGIFLIQDPTKTEYWMKDAEVHFPGIFKHGIYWTKWAIVVEPSNFKERIGWYQFKKDVQIAPPYYTENIPKAENFDEIWKQCTGI